MGIVVDSSVFIEHERLRLDIRSLTAGREHEAFFLSVITASELLHGLHRATDPAVRARRAALIEFILREWPVLPIDLATAQVHSSVWAELESRGTPIGAHDLWIAASCIANGHRVTTANVREFRRVPGLVVEEWSRSARQPRDIS
ncbi:MAG: type II toxin-antitoxin system VapC family toxin [Planctomycetes bacterium]|nr:type II toxin-antitoxin system VapC family toxin [Planctomycetota bacterium]